VGWYAGAMVILNYEPWNVDPWSQYFKILIGPLSQKVWSRFMWSLIWSDGLWFLIPCTIYFDDQVISIWAIPDRFNKLAIMYYVIKFLFCSINNSWSLFLVSKSWSQIESKGDKPCSRHGHLMVAIGTDIYIHGGMAGTKVFDDLYKFSIGETAIVEIVFILLVYEPFTQISIIYQSISQPINESINQSLD